MTGPQLTAEDLARIKAKQAQNLTEKLKSGKPLTRQEMQDLEKLESKPAEQTSRSSGGGWHDGLTEKQRRFCEAFSANGGNALDAARKAGYSKPHPQGAQNLQKATILRALESLRLEHTSSAIATREERQAFWTSVMRSRREEMKDRLRAAELLGKSHADFIDRHEHSGPSGGPIQLEELTDAELAAIASRGR